MKKAADAKPGHLLLARQVARMMARSRGVVTADDVGYEMEGRGIPVGPWCGSVFKGSEWVFTGERVRSTRLSNHGREIKVWRLK